MCERRHKRFSRVGNATTCPGDAGDEREIPWTVKAAYGRPGWSKNRVVFKIYWKSGYFYTKLKRQIGYIGTYYSVISGYFTQAAAFEGLYKVESLNWLFITNSDATCMYKCSIVAKTDIHQFSNSSSIASSSYHIWVVYKFTRTTGAIVEEKVLQFIKRHATSVTTLAKARPTSRSLFENSRNGNGHVLRRK